MELVNFTNLSLRKKSYGGANGNKLSVIMNGDLYMLKLPSHAPKNPNLSYANSCISEYLGSHIFSMLGVTAQDTILGSFTYKGVERIAVACKDFEKNGYSLQDFASVKNQIVDSRSNGYGTELKDILETIESQQLIDPVLLSNHFWDMFIVDALIGNWDRHNGNWGFLYNQENDDIKLAPIFDCGSCLYPQLNEEGFIKVLNDNQELNARIFDFPTSAIMINGKRINYYEFIKKKEYSECNKALDRIVSRIELNKINNLINDISIISDNNRLFLIKIINERYKHILLENK